MPNRLLMSNTSSWLGQGLEHQKRGELQQALACYAQLLRADPQHAPAWQLVAMVRAKLGAWEESLFAAEQALRYAPDDALSWRSAAQALYRLGRLPQALHAYDRVLAATPQDAGAWHGSSVILLRTGRAIDAQQRATRAVALSPDNAKYVEHERHCSIAAVPDWHFNMMNDEARNRSFARAIDRSVQPGMTVLEIGTGSGLLSLLAARGREGVGGAQRVVTCEANPVIAAAAQRIIAQNGWSDRITVIAKPSHELQVGVDLAEPADLLISETFSVQVVVEGALSTFEDAKARLLKPGAPILPARALVRGALVGGEGLAQSARVGNVLGFDLSPFNEFTPRQQYVSAGQPLRWLSDPATLLRFDLQNDAHFPPARQELAVTATEPGLCQGVLQWLRLEHDDENAYEVLPGATSSDGGARHWTPVWYPFPTPLMVEPGQPVALRVSHNRTGLS
ncbi:MAG: methyltransferase, partial [Polyangiaceae bacterium]|nr:methyltransferase [Polyangiaceae bacterium]